MGISHEVGRKEKVYIKKKTLHLLMLTWPAIPIQQTLVRHVTGQETSYYKPYIMNSWSECVRVRKIGTTVLMNHLMAPLVPTVLYNTLYD